LARITKTFDGKSSFDCLGRQPSSADIIPYKLQNSVENVPSRWNIEEEGAT